MCDPVEPVSTIRRGMLWLRLLCGICLVVHKEEFEVTGVVDQEDLVSRWSQMTSLLVVSVSDLSITVSIMFSMPIFHQFPLQLFLFPPVLPSEIDTPLA